MLACTRFHKRGQVCHVTEGWRCTCQDILYATELFQEDEGVMMTTDELAALKVDKLVDARGTACQGPLLEARRAIGISARPSSVRLM
jgi:hypothetical protein